jgi:hypothetical protein
MWHEMQLSGGEVACLCASGARQLLVVWQLRHRLRKEFVAWSPRS